MRLENTRLFDWGLGAYIVVLLGVMGVGGRLLQPFTQGKCVFGGDFWWWRLKREVCGKGWDCIPRVCGERARRGGTNFAVFFGGFCFFCRDRLSGARGWVWIWCTSCRERNPNVLYGCCVAPLPPLNGFSKMMAGLYKQEKLRTAVLRLRLRFHT